MFLHCLPFSEKTVQLVQMNQICIDLRVYKSFDQIINCSAVTEKYQCLNTRESVHNNQGGFGKKLQAVAAFCIAPLI